MLEDGQVIAIKKSNKKVAFIGCEDRKLLKLHSTSTLSRSYAFLTKAGNLSPILLWHARFGHINYDRICIIIKNNVARLPTLPKITKKCEACILAKQHRDSFPLRLASTHNIAAHSF